jgi:hypothetical protein
VSTRGKLSDVEAKLSALRNESQATQKTLNDQIAAAKRAAEQAGERAAETSTVLHSTPPFTTLLAIFHAYRQDHINKRCNSRLDQS